MEFFEDDMGEFIPPKRDFTSKFGR